MTEMMKSNRSDTSESRFVNSLLGKIEESNSEHYHLKKPKQRFIQSAHVQKRPQYMNQDIVVTDEVKPPHKTIEHDDITSEDLNNREQPPQQQRGMQRDLQQLMIPRK